MSPRASDRVTACSFRGSSAPSRRSILRLVLVPISARSCQPSNPTRICSSSGTRLTRGCWIRVRETPNAHDLRLQSGHPALAHESIEGRPDDAVKDYRTTRWYVHAYLHADDPDILPIDEERLDGLQFGGKRNYGYGEVRLKGTQLVDLDEITFDYLEATDADAFAIELLTPYVLESTYPNVDDHSVPWWWDTDPEGLREREEKLLAGGQVYRLRTVDHGQIVGYAGDRPLETARNGLFRVGSHAKYGFGEFRLRPIDADTRPFDEDIALRQ